MYLYKLLIEKQRYFDLCVDMCGYIVSEYIGIETYICSVYRCNDSKGSIDRLIDR